MTGTSSRTAPDRDAFADAAEVFQLLSTPVRLHLLWFLSNDEVDVTTLVHAIGSTKAGVSQHLAKLRLAGWIEDDERDDTSSTESSTPTSSPWSTRGSNTSWMNEPHKHHIGWTFVCTGAHENGEFRNGRAGRLSWGATGVPGGKRR